MIFEDISFDPVRDIQPVEQFGFIDLKTALETSVVPSQLPGSDQDYNGIDDPARIVGKPSDVFEAIMAQKAFEQVVSTAPSEGNGESDA